MTGQNACVGCGSAGFPNATTLDRRRAFVPAYVCSRCDALRPLEAPWDWMRARRLAGMERAAAAAVLEISVRALLKIERGDFCPGQDLQRRMRALYARKKEGSV